MQCSRISKNYFWLWFILKNWSYFALFRPTPRSLSCAHQKSGVWFTDIWNQFFSCSDSQPLNVVCHVTNPNVGWLQKLKRETLKKTVLTHYLTSVITPVIKQKTLSDAWKEILSAFFFSLLWGWQCLWARPVTNKVRQIYSYPFSSWQRTASTWLVLGTMDDTTATCMSTSYCHSSNQRFSLFRHYKYWWLHRRRQHCRQQWITIHPQLCSYPQLEECQCSFLAPP